MVAISQSGQCPDMIGVVAGGQCQARPTPMISKEADSPFAQWAELVACRRETCSEWPSCASLSERNHKRETMTDSTMAMEEESRKLGSGLDGDTVREIARIVSQMLMESEVEQQIGAARYERSAARTQQRHGYRERETQVGNTPLRIPKARNRSYFLSLLEPRRRAGRALQAMVQSACADGVSTQKGEDCCRLWGSPA